MPNAREIGNVAASCQLPRSRPMSVGVVVVVCLALYGIAGVLTAAVFAMFGVTRVLSGAVQVTPGARVLLLPAAAALWPLVLARWIAADGRR
jgi:hypothetical protein